tara:strand:+ start:11527 stop:12588 length:1062 start_codon:yes stop_codon:yes gene_type:complete
MSYSRSLSRRRRDFNNPNVSPATTYAGVHAAPFVAPALKLASTLQNNFVRQIDGIQNKAVISTLSSTGVIQAANCDWNDNDSLTLGERVLTLTDLSVMEALCRGTLLPTWAGMTGARETMTAGSPEFVNFSMATVAGYAAQGVENAIWQGSAVFAGGFLSNDGTFDNAGYRASILAAGGTEAAPNTNEETVTAGGFGAGQILSATGAFSEVYTNAVTNCPAILNRNDVAFYCSTKTAAAYMQALATSGSASATLVGQGVNSQSTNQAFSALQYLGVPIHVCPGMFDDALVLTYEENLVVGSNLNTDYTTAQYIDAWQYDGSDNVKIAMRFGLGCQVGIPGDVVVGALAAVFTD